MNRLIFLFSILILVSCKEPRKSSSNSAQEKRVEVSVNQTIETFMILRSISQDDPLFQYRDSNYKGKPIMYEAREFFAEYKNHPAVLETQNMLNATSSTGDMILQGLLYFEELPSNSLKHEISSEYWNKRKDSLTAYINTLQNFYEDARVGEFISKHSYFYEGAIAEAKSYLDDNLIPIMEDYFGMKNHAYHMILIPNSPFGMGFGANTKSEDGDIFFQIISPANDVEWDSSSTYESYGFSGEGADEYYRDLVVHEFCHPFITPYIESEKLKSQIAKTDSLFVPKLDSIMSKQGYGTWWGFVNEHLVRLGEIRVARAMDIPDLDAMRKYNIEENGFILLPKAEELVLHYESNRDKYGTFQDFIPVLIKQLETFNKKQINSKLMRLTKDTN
ncbi:DUF4932 domain-containing protein [Owenweeksia hongkongensis]|uniref:DUF4932 domain-containing protein n=1 Tax=Owenweeksia hongkongensis TaxID=253245 RepID=UPI003A8DAF76